MDILEKILKTMQNDQTIFVNQQTITCIKDKYFIHEIDTLLNFKNIINLFKNENIYSIVDDQDQTLLNVL